VRKKPLFFYKSENTTRELVKIQHEIISFKQELETRFFQFANWKFQ